MYPVLSQYLSADVDLEERIRLILARPSSALLNWQLIFAIPPFGPAVLDGDCLKSVRFTGFPQGEVFFKRISSRAPLDFEVVVDYGLQVEIEVVEAAFCFFECESPDIDLGNLVDFLHG